MTRRLLLVTALLAGCGDPTPEVEILSLDPGMLVVGDDVSNDAVLRLRYRDDDGDLGHGVAQIHDCRSDALVLSHALPPIANDEALAEEVAIDGELSVTVSDIGALEPLGSAPCASFGAPALAPSTLAFCVVLVDAAGHASEGACSPVIDVVQP
jgi:hypothetical protein